MRNTRSLLLAVSICVTACGKTPDAGTSLSAPAESEPVEAPPQLFADVTALSGVDFRHVAGADGAWMLPEIMGGGGALFDLDDDGDLDLVLLAGALRSADPDSPPSGQGHALYRNDGAGHFEDISEAAGLDHLRGYAMGVTAGDLDGDGHVDLYVTQYGRSALLAGDGEGHFQDVTEARHAGVSGWSSSGAVVDFDADGDLDLYVVRYIELQTRMECRDSTGRRTHCPPTSGPALPDVLLRNDGERFTDISAEVGLTASAYPGLGVVAEDLTGDSQPDLYVANDGTVNQLWVRQVDGTWRDEAIQRGVALNQNGAAEASMGLVAEDLDGDGLTDLFMTHLQEETHTLYGARAAGVFRDRTGAAGLGVVTRPSTGFGVTALDLELDGDLDLAIAQGRIRVGARHPDCHLEGVWSELAEPNLLLVNDGAGRFAAPTGSATALTSPVMVDRSVLSGDLDGDGDIDLIFTRNEGAAQVLMNTAPRRGTWILIDPRDSAKAATKIGARVTVRGSDRPRTRTSRSSDGYQSSRDPRVHFGLPLGTERVDVEVHWPNGARETFTALASGRTHRLVRGTGEQE